MGNATTITGYKKEAVLLGKTITYQTEVNNPLVNEKSEENESSLYNPFKYEYVASFLTALSITLTIFATLFGIWGLVYDRNEIWAIGCMLTLILTAVALVLGCILPFFSYNKELLGPNPLFLIGGIMTGIFLAGAMVLYVCCSNGSKNYYVGLKKAILNIIVAIIELVACILDIIWVKKTVIESILAFIILIFIPFILSMRVIYKTVSNVDKIKVVATVLTILGFIGLVVALIWTGIINTKISAVNMLYFFLILLLVFFTQVVIVI